MSKQGICLCSDPPINLPSQQNKEKIKLGNFPQDHAQSLKIIDEDVDQVIIFSVL